MAETATDRAERRRWLTFALVGGGPTGVELAGQIRELATRRPAGRVPPASSRRTRGCCCSTAGPSRWPRSGRSCRRRRPPTLQDRGVELHMHSLVTEVDADGLVVRDASGDETRYDAGTVLWTAGMKAPPLADTDRRRNGRRRSDQAGRIEVDAGPHHRRSPGDHGGRRPDEPRPPSGRRRGGDAVRRSTPAAGSGSRCPGEPAPRPFRYVDLGSAAYISRGRAVVSAGPLQLSGLASGG